MGLGLRVRVGVRVRVRVRVGVRVRARVRVRVRVGVGVRARVKVRPWLVWRRTSTKSVAGKTSRREESESHSVMQLIARALARSCSRTSSPPGR